MAVQPEDVRLLANAQFRRLLQSRVIGQTAQNAMLYALLILVVQDTDSSLKSTLLIVSLTLPSVIVGIPAGTIADILPKRLTLTLGYLLRAVIAVALIYYRGDLVLVYVLAGCTSIVSQFFSPAEAATVPAIVRRDQLPAANSLMVFSLILAQIAGMVIVAPALIKVIGVEAVFVTSAVLFLIATYVIGWMASGFTREQDEKPPTPDFVSATKEGFRILRTNRQAYLAILYLITALMLSKMLVILMPKYTRDVLSISPEDTVFVAAPAAIGAGLGLLLAPPLARLFGAWRVVGIGFAIFLVGLIALGLIVYVRDFIQANLDFGITFMEDNFSVPSVITVTMIVAMPIGFAFTLVGVAARVVMNEQAPPEAQGRIFAVQMAVGDFAALLPLLMVGVIADVVGVRATLLTAAILAAGAATYLTFGSGFGPPPHQREPAMHGLPPEVLEEPG